MTEIEAKALALVERLRKGDWNPEWGEYTPCDDRDAAADLIETQAREIERLRGLVSSYRLQIDQLHDSAALGYSHDQ